MSVISRPSAPPVASFVGKSPRRTKREGVRPEDGASALQRIAARLARRIEGFRTPRELYRNAHALGCGYFGCAYAVGKAVRYDERLVKITTDPLEGPTLWWLTFGVPETYGTAPHQALPKTSGVYHAGPVWGPRGETDAFVIIREDLHDIDSDDAVAADDTVLAALRRVSGGLRIKGMRRIPSVREAERILEESRGSPWEQMVELYGWMEQRHVHYTDWKSDNCGIRMRTDGSTQVVLHDLGYSTSPVDWTELPRLNESAPGAGVAGEAAIPTMPPALREHARRNMPRL